MPGALLWGWDDTNREWIPLAVDENGYVQVDMSNINLDDLADVDVSGVADDDFFYYDSASGLWKPRKLVDADIPAAIARDTEVDAAVSDHAGLPSVHHTKYTDAEALAAAAAGMRKIHDADGDTSWDVEESADKDEVVGKVKAVEFFRGHDDGILTLAKQSACKVYRATSTQSIPDTTLTKAGLNAAAFDIQNEFDITTNYRFVAKQAGIYLASVYGYLLNLGNGKAFNIGIQKNGADIGYSGIVVGASAHARPGFTTLAQLAIGDYLEMHVWHNHGSARDLNIMEERTGMMVVKVA